MDENQEFNQAPVQETDGTVRSALGDHQRISRAHSEVELSNPANPGQTWNGELRRNKMGVGQITGAVKRLGKALDSWLLRQGQ